MTSTNRIRRSLAVAATLALALGGALITVAPASATSGPVDTTSDTVGNTLRAAIIAANSDTTADTITITATGTLTLASDLPPITQPVTINGPGAASFTIDGTASGYDALTSTAAIAITITELTIENAGLAKSTGGIDIQSMGSSLTLVDVTVTGSFYGVQVDGGVLDITNSTFTGSTADGVHLDTGAAGSSIVDTTINSNGSDGLDANLTGAGTLTATNSVANLNANDGFDIEPHGTSEVQLTTTSADNNGNDGYELDLDGDSTATLTGTTATSNDEQGFDSDASDTSTLNFGGSTATENAYEGFLFVLHDSSTATLTDVTASGNGLDGFDTALYDDATVTATTTTSTDNFFEGIDLDQENQSIASFTSTTATNNGSDGVDAEAEDDAQLTITDMTASGNRFDGVDVDAESGATITVDGITSSLNGNSALRVSSNGQNVSGDPSTVTATIVTGTTSEEGTDIEAFDGGLVTISDSVFTDNVTRGILIDCELPGGVGLRDSTGSVVTIRDTTISGNGDGTFNGAGLEVINTSDLAIQIEATNISGNLGDRGGGIYALGDTDAPFHLTIVNSTISGNTGATVGGIFIDSQESDSQVAILNSTVTKNIVEEVGPSGVGITGDYSAEIHNTILAGNLEGGSFSGIHYGDLDVSSSSSAVIDYSLIQDPSAATIPIISAGTGNLTSIDPLLGPLADNGGPTLTHLPQTNSPVVEAGEPAFVALAYDQRGQDRVVNRLDMGAVELQPHLAATGIDVRWALLSGLLAALTGVVLLLVRARRRDDVTM